MAQLAFTANLKRHVEAPTTKVDGSTVGEVLDSYFNEHPLVRGYVLDDQGAVRHHVAIFLYKTTINGIKSSRNGNYLTQTTTRLNRN